MDRAFHRSPQMAIRAQDQYFIVDTGNHTTWAAFVPLLRLPKSLCGLAPPSVRDNAIALSAVGRTRHPLTLLCRLSARRAFRYAVSVWH